MPTARQVLRAIDYLEYVIAWEQIPPSKRPGFHVIRDGGEWHLVDSRPRYLGTPVLPVIGPNREGRYARPGWANARWPDGRVYSHWREQLK